MSDIKNKPEQIRGTVRELKAMGFSYDEIGLKLGISKQLAHYHGRPTPGEGLCSQCLRPLKKQHI